MAVFVSMLSNDTIDYSHCWEYGLLDMTVAPVGVVYTAKRLNYNCDYNLHASFQQVSVFAFGMFPFLACLEYDSPKRIHFIFDNYYMALQYDIYIYI